MAEAVTTNPGLPSIDVSASDPVSETECEEPILLFLSGRQFDNNETMKVTLFWQEESEQICLVTSHLHDISLRDSLFGACSCSCSCSFPLFM